MSKERLFTSESVSEGHPDKMADQISDAVLDAILEQDSHARVACETMIKTGAVIVGGEITTGAWVDLEERSADILVKLLGPIRWTFSEPLYFSRHGPVLKLDHGTFAIRWAGMGETRTLEQYLALNKASNQAEFEAALAEDVEDPAVRRAARELGEAILMRGRFRHVHVDDEQEARVRDALAREAQRDEAP